MARWVCGGVGVALLVAAGVSARSVWLFAVGASHAEGVVVALSAGGSHPRVRFTTQAGAEIVFSGGGLVFGYAVGQGAPVLYNASAAQESARLAAFGSLWFVPIILGLIGLGWVFVPLSEWLF